MATQHPGLLYTPTITDKSVRQGVRAEISEHFQIPVPSPPMSHGTTSSIRTASVWTPINSTRKAAKPFPTLPRCLITPISSSVDDIQQSPPKKKTKYNDIETAILEYVNRCTESPNETFGRLVALETADLKEPIRTETRLKILRYLLKLQFAVRNQMMDQINID